MNKNIIFYKKEKVFGRSRRLFKHIKNNKIYIIDNKEYVPLNKYLKKKYVGGMFNNNDSLTHKIKLLYSMYKIIYNINNNIKSAQLNNEVNQNIKNFIENSEFEFNKSKFNFEKITANPNIAYIKLISQQFLKYNKRVIVSINFKINKYREPSHNILNNFKTKYLLPFESILKKDIRSFISSFKPKYVIIKAPPKFFDDQNVKFHSLHFDDGLGLLYVTYYDKSNELISIPIQYVYAADMYQGKPINEIFVGGKKSKK